MPSCVSLVGRVSSPRPQYQHKPDWVPDAIERLEMVGGIVAHCRDFRSMPLWGGNATEVREGGENSNTALKIPTSGVGLIESTVCRRKTTWNSFLFGCIELFFCSSRLV